MSSPVHESAVNIPVTAHSFEMAPVLAHESTAIAPFHSHASALAVPATPRTGAKTIDEARAWVQSTPVKQITGHDGVLMATPRRYESRLRSLQQLCRGHESTSLPPSLAAELLAFLDDFQGMYADIAKMKHHLDTLREREIDLAKTEIESLQQHFDAILHQQDDHHAVIEQYEAQIRDMCSHIDALRDRELDLANNELIELNQQFGACMKVGLCLAFSRVH